MWAFGFFGFSLPGNGHMKEPTTGELLVNTCLGKEREAHLKAIKTQKNKVSEQYFIQFILWM